MPNLNTAGQHLVEDVSPFLHDADVVQRGVGALAVLDGINEAVSELLHGPQQILLDEVHHAVVCVGGRRRRSHTSVRHERPGGFGGAQGRPCRDRLCNRAVSHSMRLFCRGVPVSTTLLRVLMEFMALETADASFFKMWPSSQITKSGPGASRTERVKLFYFFEPYTFLFSHLCHVNKLHVIRNVALCSQCTYCHTGTYAHVFSLD